MEDLPTRVVLLEVESKIPRVGWGKWEKMFRIYFGRELSYTFEPRESTGQEVCVSISKEEKELSDMLFLTIPK